MPNTLQNITVWKDRANAASIQLIKNSVALDEVEMGLITKVSLRYKGVYYSSEDYPDAFDTVTSASEGKVIIRAGLIPLAVGSDVVELLIYDNYSTEGIMWTQIAVQVRGDAVV